MKFLTSLQVSSKEMRESKSAYKKIPKIISSGRVSMQGYFLGSNDDDDIIMILYVQRCHITDLEDSNFTYQYLSLY